MGRLDFSQLIAIGVDEIDEQHKDLIGMINVLYDLGDDDGGAPFLSDLIGELLEYAGLHFATEEKYMEITGYPDLATHRSEHGLFSDKVHEFDQRNLNGDLKAFEIFSFLSNWFVAHLMETDGQFAAYLREQGFV